MTQAARSLCSAVSILLWLCCLPSLVAAEEIRAPKAIRPHAVGVTACSPQQLAPLKERMAALAKASRELRELAIRPVPKGLGYDETKQAYRYGQWLRSTSDRLDVLEQKGRRLLDYCEAKRQAGPRAMVEAEMAEMSRAFNLQYLQLQNSISQENRQFSMISNIMKNRHDTAKNAINNIR